MPEDFTPFKKIGLCFSGGGYRATFFSLGTAAYLEHITFEGEPLLKNVIALSTVSGGTLFGVAFTKAVRAPNFKFTNFYAEMYTTFTPANDTLLNDAVAKLSKNEIWKTNGHKRQSLINAFALQYAEMPLFSGKFAQFNLTGKKLSAATSANEAPYKLAHVCFNATDFSFGLPFRFQNSGKFGNKALTGVQVNALKEETILGDIVAASSCFPLGFEPLIFPDDFYGHLIKTGKYDERDPLVQEDAKDKYETYKKLKELTKFKEGVGIMDGGITDNQGIDSMLNIHNRKKSKLDLIIINDVSSFQMDAWQYSKLEVKNTTSLHSTATNLLRWLDIKALYVILFISGIALIIYSFYANITIQPWALLLGGILTGAGGLLTAAGVFAKHLKKRLIYWFNTSFNKTVPPALLDEVSSFKHLGLDLVKKLLVDRATSAAAMLQSVFLNQIRRLNYDNFYKNPELQNMRITSRVDELDGKNTVYKKFKIDPDIKMAASKELKKTATLASEMPTTLWWDEHDKKVKRMDALIACGQFTTCYNLLTYIIELKKANITSPAIEQLETQLIADWGKFNENPYWLV